MYILLCGFPPFQGPNSNELYKSIKQCSYILDRYGWETVSKDAKDLIKKILVAQPERLSAEKALKHKWITSLTKKEKQEKGIVKNVLDNLIDFNAQNKLQEAAKLFIITHLMSTTEIKEARGIFQELDENGDGRLSREELVKGYKRFMSQKDAEVIVDKIMLEVDTDNNGYIDYNEFLKAAIDIKQVASTEYLESAFKMFDKDKSGKISVDELKAVLHGGERDDAIFEKIIKQVDLDGDGEIDLNEFTAILQNVKYSG